jgi:phospholipase A-2-activating protein
LAYAPPSKEYPDGLIISSGQDTLIEARQPSTTAEGNAEGFMVGHNNQVCALDVCGDREWMVSGSWDSTAKVWQLGKWETDVDLSGHTATVWAVVAYDRDTIITGCADRAIRIFDTRGKMMASFDGKDVVRALTRLPEGHPTGAQFASATNDGAIRLWTLKGDLMAELWGHDSFIYSLTVLPTGEIVSSGEDRSVRVWNGTDCVQVITLPAISVWSVSVCPNGDFIVGSSDKMARIFTREQERLADSTIIQQFDEAVQSSAIPQQTAGGVNMSDLPGPDFLTRKLGTKEGQTQIIKDDDGSPTVYQWSMSQQTWIKIGQLVDSAEGSKKTYGGQEYDYVFDIDIEDGKPALKLPYNVTQNPYEAATKFLQDNELPISYLEETANFIIKNTQGATIGQTQPAGADPWGTESRYRPGEVASSSYQPKSAATKQPLPHTEFLSIVLGKPIAAVEQIVKRNAEYGDTDMALTVSEMDILKKVAEQLSKHNFSSQYSLSAPAGLDTAVPSLIKIATNWQPSANRLAAIDLLRFLAAALKTFPSTEDDVVGAILGSGIFDAENILANSKLVMISMRLFSNLLYGGGKEIVEEHIDNVVESLRPVTDLAKSDNNVGIAYTTLCLNLAVFITTKNTDPDMSAHRGLTLVEELIKFIAALATNNHAVGAIPSAQSTESAYRAVMALGTLLVGLKREEVTSAAKDIFDVPKVLDGLKGKKYLDEPRFKVAVAQIRSVL